jgi:hypothetical protein
MSQLAYECRYCHSPLPAPAPGDRFYASCRPMCAAEGELAGRLSRGEPVPGGPGACAREGCGHLTLLHGEHGKYQSFSRKSGTCRGKPCTKCGCPAFAAQGGTEALEPVKAPVPELVQLDLFGAVVA